MTTTTFTWVPFDPPNIKYSHRVLESVFENGTKQKKYKGPNPTVWELTFKTSWAQMSEIRDFFNARKGSFESFEWYDPWGKTTKTVRFASDELSIETEFMLNGLFTIEFEEVL